MHNPAKFPVTANLIKLLVPALLLQAGWLAFPFDAWGGRPLVVDDAPTVARSNIETELAFSHVKPDGAGREQQWPVIGIAYGFSENFEAGFAIQRVNNDSAALAPVKGFEDLHVTAKHRLLDEDSEVPAVSFALDVKIPTANRRKGLSSGRWEETLLLIASKSFTPIVLHLNVGYVIVDGPRGENLKNRIRGGLALEWPFADRWGFVGEAYGFSREAKGESNEADFQLGLRYLMTPQLVLDAGAGRSLRSTGKDIQGTVGVTGTFDLHKLFSRERQTK